MGAYMYPINIDRDPQKIGYTKDYELNDSELSLADLRKYVNEDETFEINYEENRIYVYGYKLETKEEVEKRVSKQEKYMKNYTEFHKNKIDR